MAEGQELASIDFQSMIGGPLVAVVKAQAQSAQTSVDFIKSVGFNPSDAKENPGKPTMVTFTYDKPVETKDDKGVVTIAPVPYKLSVPILTMLPIPFIRVEEVTIDFNAKINSVSENKTSHDTDLSASLEAKGGWGPVSASLKCSYSDKKSTSSTDKVERTYALQIHVRAVQDELPAGLDRLLHIIENNIVETKIAAPA